MFRYACNSCKVTFWHTVDYGVRNCSPCGREHREIQAVYMLALRENPGWSGLTRSMVMLKLLHATLDGESSCEVKRRVTVIGKRIAEGEVLHPDFSGNDGEVF